MDFAYTTTTEQSFDDAVKAVQDEIAKAGMRVLYVHDVSQTLAEKGFEREPFKIVEFCNAQYANEFLNLDVAIGLCLPCKINVYTTNGQTWLAAMRPTILPEFFPQVDFGRRPAEIDEIIHHIITSAAAA